MRAPRVIGCYPVSLAALALAACGGSTHSPIPTPSAQVSTVAPKQGSLPTMVTAYGAAAPAQNGTVTMSYPQPGEITSLAVTTGSVVRAGQRLLTFATAPATRSNYQQAVNALAAANKQRASTVQLLHLQLATKDQLAQADKTVADARSALAALRAGGAGRALRTLNAPFPGIVTNVAVAAGDRPQADAPLVTLARSGSIMVTVGVEPATGGAVHVGDTARVQRLSGGPNSFCPCRARRRHAERNHKDDRRRSFDPCGLVDAGRGNPSRHRDGKDERLGGPACCGGDLERFGAALSGCLGQGQGGASRRASRQQRK